VGVVAGTVVAGRQPLTDFATPRSIVDVDDGDSGHWAPGNLLRMLAASTDDVSAFMLAVNALHPGEIRSLSPILGLPDIDDLRELTLLTVITARHLGDAAAAEIRAWAGLWRGNRTAAVRNYLNQTGRNTDDR
jgi:hypothetical protein